MKPEPVIPAAAYGLEMDDGRYVGVAVTEADKARKALKKKGADKAEAQAAFQELARILRAYQGQLARHYIDGEAHQREATRDAYEMAALADPGAVEAFVRSVLESPDAVAKDLGAGVLAGFPVKASAGVRASIAAYNAAAGAQGRAAIAP